MSLAIIAIDPGASGGIAYRFQNGSVMCWPMPETRRDLIDKLRQIVAPIDINKIVAYVENPSNYIPGGSPSAMCVYGRALERPTCILETLFVRIIEVTPQRWQKGLALGNIGKAKVPKPPKGSSKEEKARFELKHAAEIKSITNANQDLKRDWKNKLKAEAQRRFPQVSGITLKTADCLLLLDYAISQEQTNLPNCNWWEAADEP